MQKENSKTDALLNEKLSDEQLDGVTGGSHLEHTEILDKIARIDREGVIDLLIKSHAQPAPLNALLSQLLNKHLSGTGLQFTGGAYNEPNQYTMNGKSITHEQFIGYLKAMGKGNDF